MSLDLKAIRERYTELDGVSDALQWQGDAAAVLADIPALLDWIERAKSVLECASFLGAGTDACWDCGKTATKLLAELE